MDANAAIYSCARLGCSALDAYDYCSFESDPDIAGIGIILSFVISVNLTFAFVLFGFYFVQDGFAAKQLNQLDRLIIRHTNKVLRPLTKQRVINRKAFRSTVLSFNDISLVTGMSIMVTAFSKTKDITMYHFAIAGDLAGLAFTIQVCAARITGEDLQRKPERLWWRAATILIISLSILVQAVPYGNRLYLGQYGGTMQCLWESTDPENYQEPFLRFTMVLWMLLQIWATLSVLDKLFPTIYHNKRSQSFGRKINDMFLLPRKWHFYVSDKRKSASGSTKNFLTCISVFTYTASLFNFIIAELVYSEALEMARNWSFLVVNVIDIFYLRSTSTRYGKVGNEDEWKFGQIVPVFLLLIPLGTLSEVLIGGVRRKQQENEDQNKEGPTAILHSKSTTSIPLEDRFYYFGYPADKLVPMSSEFEETLYENWCFCLLMPGILVLVLVIVTYGAVEGWAF